jgi:NodT family efflux transporter outer membrane factor (OMF) lipoprotein
VKAGAALLVLLSAGLAAACSLEPRYEVPSLPEANTDQYREVGQWLPAAPAEAAAHTPWWHTFGDPRLDELQDRLHDSNPDLRVAVARYEQARAVARRSWSDVFPFVDAGAALHREHTSANAPDSGGERALGNDYTANVGFAWEIDLFGRLRNAAKAASERADASAGDFAAVQLSLQAELAADYFSLRGADATLALLEDTVKAYDRALEFTRNRYNGGIASATDVDQAETQLQAARAQLAAVHLQRAQFEHAIAVLLGVPPAMFALEPAPLVGDPPPIATGLPSTLLQRRPDVAGAERRVAAANAEIGVARAAWFPVFTLGALAGYQSTDTSNWFEAPSRYWAVGPAVRVPLLDAGGRMAENRQARAAFDEAAATYRSIALNAYREVEDNLAGLRYLADEVTANEAAAASAQRAAYHAGERYTAGVADYIEVTTTQAASLLAQRNALEARVARMNAAVALVRALGGGWSADQLRNPELP